MTKDIRPTEQLHITVGIVPTNQPDFKQELLLVKAALLYGDAVTLCSPVTSYFHYMTSRTDIGQEPTEAEIIKGFHELEEMGEIAYESLRREMDESISLGQSDLPPQRGASPAALLIDMNMVSAYIYLTIRNRAHLFSNMFYLRELKTAQNSGLLSLQPLDLSDGTLRIVRQFFERVSTAVTDSNTYPLFDQPTGDLVQASLSKGLIKRRDSAIGRGKHIALVGDLFEKLPLFERAPMDELLDIRRELATPLVRFRGAIVEFSGDVSHAAWDSDFSHDVEQVYMKDVAPAMLDIEAAIKDSAALRKFLPKLSEKSLEISGTSALGFFLSQLGSLPQVVGAVLGATAGALALGHEVYQEWRDQQQDIERNQLYFYYKTGQQLKRRKKRGG